MKTKIVLASLIILAALTVAFSSKPENLVLNPGTFGISMNCGGPGKTKIELKFNADNSFHYFDNSDPKHLIDQKGTWKLSGNTIELSGYSEGAKLNDKWKLENDGQCIKSRRGLLWTRICRLD